MTLPSLYNQCRILNHVSHYQYLYSPIASADFQLLVGLIEAFNKHEAANAITLLGKLVQVPMQKISHPSNANVENIPVSRSGRHCPC